MEIKYSRERPGPSDAARAGQAALPEQIKCSARGKTTLWSRKTETLGISESIKKMPEKALEEKKKKTRGRADSSDVLVRLDHKD